MSATALDTDRSTHTTEHLWLDSDLGPLAVHLTRPDRVGTRGACLLLPPVGYPYLSGHQSVRALAEKLAEHGMATMRLDYHGTGNSSGTGLEPDRPRAWETSVAVAHDALRSATRLPVGIIGVQLGGLLALRCHEPRSWTVLWEPPPSGRRFVSSVRLLGQPIPDQDGFPGGGVSVGGFPFSTETLAELESWAASDARAPLGDVLTLSDGPAARLLRPLEQVSDSVLVRPAPTPSVLQEPAEDAVVPTAALDEVVAWVLERLPDEASASESLVLPGTRPRAQPCEDVTEHSVRIGRSGLHAVRTVPTSREDGGRAAGETDRTVTVFLNSGSEMNIGSGRAWLDYARTLAEAGHESLRLDWSGWGESPHHGARPGRPYDPHCVTDTEEVVDALVGEGKDVVLVGLCAGAWVALKVALTRQVAGVVALNPQLYWREGDPVEALITDTSERRRETRRREALGARWGLWTALDLIGLRNREGAWLTRLSSRDIPLHLVFAAGDEGLVFLQNRLARRTARVTRTGNIVISSVPEVDHSMHRLWLRAPLREAIIDFVRERARGR